QVVVGRGWGEVILCHATPRIAIHVRIALLLNSQRRPKACWSSGIDDDQFVGIVGYRPTDFIQRPRPKGRAGVTERGIAVAERRVPVALEEDATRGGA